VYVGAIVIVASIVALMAVTVAAAHRATGVPARTARRWIGWWRGEFAETSVFATLSGRLVPAVSRRELPASLLARMSGIPEEQLRHLLVWLAPLTTASIADGAPWMRGFG
jgi:hypothetical protein